MKFSIKKNIFYLFLLINVNLNAQVCDLAMDNFSNCAVNVQVLDGSLNPITAFGTVTLPGGGGGYRWMCNDPGAVPAYFQVDYGTCNTIIVDLSTNNFGPFTPLICCPCGITLNGSVSTFMLLQLNPFCTNYGYTYHLNIQ